MGRKSLRLGTALLRTFQPRPKADLTCDPSRFHKGKCFSLYILADYPNKLAHEVSKVSQ
jgi:hypothetical protein